MRSRVASRRHGVERPVPARSGTRRVRRGAAVVAHTRGVPKDCFQWSCFGERGLAARKFGTMNALWPRCGRWPPSFAQGLHGARGARWAPTRELMHAERASQLPGKKATSGDRGRWASRRPRTSGPNFRCGARLQREPARASLTRTRARALAALCGKRSGIIGNQARRSGGVSSGGKAQLRAGAGWVGAWRRCACAGSARCGDGASTTSFFR